VLILHWKFNIHSCIAPENAPGPKRKPDRLPIIMVFRGDFFIARLGNGKSSWLYPLEGFFHKDDTLENINGWNPTSGGWNMMFLLNWVDF